MDSNLRRAEVHMRIAELSKRYDAAEDSGDNKERREVYDQLIRLGARMMSDGRFHPLT